MEKKLPHQKIPIRIKEITELLKPHGIDFNQFLRQLKVYHKNNAYRTGASYERPKNTRAVRKKNDARSKSIAIKHFFRKKYYGFLFKLDIGIKYRLACLSDGINSTRLLEAFMTAYVDGDPAIEEVMKVIHKYHEKKIYRGSKHFPDRLKATKRIFKYYNLPTKWWKKYTDLKTDDLT